MPPLEKETPPSQDDAWKHAWLSFRPEKLEEVKKAARRRQMSVTTWLRLAAERQLEHEAAKNGHAAP